VGPVLLIIENLENVQNEDQMISDHAMLHLLQTLLTNLREGRVLITGRSMRNELLVQETFPQCAQRDVTSCGELKGVLHSACVSLRQRDVSSPVKYKQGNEKGL
jgi:hypothetical protein